MLRKFWRGASADPVKANATMRDQKLNSYKSVFGPMGRITIPTYLFGQSLVFYSPGDEAFFIGRWEDLRRNQAGSDLLYRCPVTAVDQTDPEISDREFILFQSHNRADANALPPLRPVLTQMIQSLGTNLGFEMTRPLSPIVFKNRAGGVWHDTLA